MNALHEMKKLAAPVKFSTQHSNCYLEFFSTDAWKAFQTEK